MKASTVHRADDLGPDHGWLRTLDAGRQRLLRIAVAVSGLLVLTYLASYVVMVPIEYSTIRDGWLGHGAEAVPVMVLGFSVLWRKRDRVAWACITAGSALNLLGSLTYSLYDQNLVPIPSPSLSDVPYLASYVLFAIGFALLAFRFVRNQRKLILDGLIAGLSTSAVAAAMYFAPILSASGNRLQIVVGLAYPLFDLVLLALIVGGLAPLRYRPTWSSSLLFLGGLTFTIADVRYLSLLASDRYVAGTVLDAVWTVGVSIFALASWAPIERRVPSQSNSRLSVIPPFFAACALGVLAYASFRPVPILTSLLAVAALLLALLRGLLTVRELRMAGEGHRLARTDDLTGLPNRRAFFEQLDQAMQARTPFSVLMIDLDGFKYVNDTLGHQVGDDLLRHVAERFDRALPARSVLARLGGDEFGAWIPTVLPNAASGLADDLLASLKLPFAVDGITLRVAASIGISNYPTDGDDCSDLMRFADLAMYHAKQHRLGVSHYQANANSSTRESLQLFEDLRVAVADDALSVYFQPMVCLRSGEVLRLEALARWEHPTRGLVMPDVFIPLAERSDLIFGLTRTILRQAISQVAAYRHEHGAGFGVGVNISALDLSDESLIEFVVATCAHYDLPTHALTLEITETALTMNPAHAAERVRRLRELGVRISIDDFGVGYSSMSQLLDLAVDELKLDRSFVMPMERDPRAEAIVTLTIQLSRALGLDMVAEGVESAAILKALADAGCDVAQGYHVARPAPLAALANVLADGCSIPETDPKAAPEPVARAS